MLKRNEVDKKYKWDLTKFYKKDADWFCDYEKLKSYLPKLKKFKGKLNDKDKLFKFLQLDVESDLIFDKLYMYAMNNLNVQLNSQKYNEMNNQLTSLSSVFSEAVSFFSPELLSYNEKYLKELINDVKFKDYKFSFKELIRQKKHILTEKEEQLLTGIDTFSSDCSDLFDSLTNVDFKFDKAKDSSGKEYEVNYANISLLLKNKDRVLRKNAYESYYGKYKEFNNTIALNYITNLKADTFYSKVRHFNSVLDMSLYSDNIDKKIFDNLKNHTLKHINLCDRYYKLRKKILKLNELHNYDLSVNLCDELEHNYSTEEAENLVINALQPLGEEYLKGIKYGFNHRWIDFYPMENKLSGGYETGCYNSTPIVLLNYNNEINDVFTLAHEMGHAMHTMYANSSQPYETCEYTIFLAEIASTFNEVLLNKYLYNQATLKNEKIYYLDRYIELFIGTIFTQMQYSIFEEFAHDLVQNNLPISKEILNDKYKELNKKFAKSVYSDDLKSYHWSIVPHFYNSFYVYKYASGLISSVCLATNVLKNGKLARDKYFNFLKAGGSDYSINILKKAGVDLLTDEPYNLAFAELKWAIDELEKLI